MALENDVQALTAAIRELTVVLSSVSANPPAAAPVAEKPAAKKTTKSAATATDEGTSTTAQTKESQSASAETEEMEDLTGTDDLTGVTEDAVSPEQFFKDSLLPLARKLIEAKKQPEVKAVLTKHKAPQLSALPADLDVYRAVLADLEAING